VHSDIRKFEKFFNRKDMILRDLKEQVMKDIGLEEA